MPRKNKICLVASAGGHMSQLQKISRAWDGMEVFYITTGQMIRNELSQSGKVYVVGECNRRHPVKVIKVLLKCLKILYCERPDVTISTGAAVGCIACFAGKLIRSRIVWIDSIANVARISLSGRMVRHIADLFLVQWVELADAYPGVEYVGSII